MLYGLWDPELSQVIMGPVEMLPFEYLGMTKEELIANNWYEVEYRYSDPNFDPMYQEIDSIAPYVEANTTLVLDCTVKWKSVDELKEIKNTRINELRDEHAMGGFIYGGVKFDSDEAARSNITGSITTINSGLLLEAAHPGMEIVPDQIAWTLYDNSTAILTSVEMISMGLKMSGWLSGVFMAGRQHKDAVALLTDPAEIATYDVETALWPSNDIGGTIDSLSAS